MIKNDVLIEFLGLQDIDIEKVDFNRLEASAVIYAKQPFKKSYCKSCESLFFELHQWHSKSLRLPPLGVYKKVTLILKTPRGYCGNCLKVKGCKLPLFIHPEFKGLSCGFAEVAGRLMEEITCEAAARLLSYNSKQMWKLDQWRCEYLKKYLYKLPEELDISCLSADEVHYKTKYFTSRDRAHPFSPRYEVQFITSLVCASASKVIATSPGRDMRALSRCLNVLSKEKLKKVKFISVDMNPSYFKAIMKTCPDAEIAVDRFHLVQKLNDAFDAVRKQEYAKAHQRKDSFQKTMLSRGNRFLYLEKTDTKSIEEHNMLGKIKMLNTQINNAMIMTDYFHTVLDQKGLHNFRKRLLKWYGLVRESRSKIFKKFAKKVRKFRSNIEAYIKTGLTTAVSEGINNKIKVLKRMGYGYTNKKAFQNKILQRCGFLNSSNINTNFMMWHVTTPHK